MATRLILVNGLPGSGKTTLATALAGARGVPLISKDAIKEAVAEAVPGIPSRTIGVAASRMLWELAAGVDGEAVLESWWFRPRDRDFVRAGLIVAGCPAAVAEVWCQVPAAVARERYAARHRSPVHEDARRLTDSWETWAAGATPLDIGLTIPVRTDIPVDLAALHQRLDAWAEAQSGHAQTPRQPDA